MHDVGGSDVSPASRTIGRVFNIQRFAVHDGPGVRTTVFFKGCPARCPWCHNPESQSPDPEVMHAPERCIACGSCEAVCPYGLCPDDVDAQRCGGCTRCADLCPTGARQITGRSVGIEEVMADVESDGVFFDSSGGGLTCSGGEPLSQPDFLRRLLEAARSRGLTTCVDTCGAGSRRTLLAIAPLTDLFLYDLKTMDAQRHRACTGLPLAPILGNLAALAAVHQAIWIRMPVIPGFTDDDESFEQAAQLLTTLPGVRRVHLLPYHRQGSAKYRRLGRRYGLADVAAPSADRMAGIAALFRRRGLDTHIGGDT